MAARNAGPSLLARLLLILLGLAFLGAAWVWSHRDEPWAGRLVQRVHPAPPAPQPP